MVLALAVSGALAVAGIALANSPTSSISFKCSGRAVPNKCPKSASTKGSLNLHIHINYTNPGSANGGHTRRIRLNLDNDFRFDLTVTPASCDPAQLSARDMATVMTGPCRPDLVGTGTGQAIAGGGAFTVPACLLLFNGTTDADPERGRPRLLIYARAAASSPPNNTISCANPTTNHQGNQTVVLQGILKPSPLTVDYRQQIDIRDIFTTFPLADLNFSLQRNTASSGYVNARCFDANRVWNLRTVFTYNNATTQTVNSTRTCTVG